MTTRLERSGSGAIIDRSPSDLRGTWTVDPATSIVSLAWRALGLWTVTGRWQCLGVIQLDALPPVGVIRFRQPSGLPFLTIASDPVGLEAREVDRRQRWWSLHSQSLEILPGGAWRVMATLTTHRPLVPVELRMELDPRASGRDRLVLRGRAVLDRRTFASGKRAWTFDPTIRLDLVARQTSRKEA